MKKKSLKFREFPEKVWLSVSTKTRTSAKLYRTFTWKIDGFPFDFPGKTREKEKFLMQSWIKFSLNFEEIQSSTRQRHEKLSIKATQLFTNCTLKLKAANSFPSTIPPIIHSARIVIELKQFSSIARSFLLFKNTYKKSSDLSVTEWNKINRKLILGNKEELMGLLFSWISRRNVLSVRRSKTTPQPYYIIQTFGQKQSKICQWLRCRSQANKLLIAI